MKQKFTLIQLYWVYMNNFYRHKQKLSMGFLVPSIHYMGLNGMSNEVSKRFLNVVLFDGVLFHQSNLMWDNKAREEHGFYFLWDRTASTFITKIKKKIEWNRIKKRKKIKGIFKINFNKFALDKGLMIYLIVSFWILKQRLSDLAVCDHIWLQFYTSRLSESFVLTKTLRSFSMCRVQTMFISPCLPRHDLENM